MKEQDMEDPEANSHLLKVMGLNFQEKYQRMFSWIKMVLWTLS